MAGVELLVDAVAIIDDEVVPDAWVAIADGRIQAVGAGRNQPPEADVRTSLHGATVLPGFIDLHVHGGGGSAFGADEGANQRAAGFHLLNGTTALLPTLATATMPALLSGAGTLGLGPEVRPGQARLLGLHLEGPFISPDRRGAHDPKLIRPPDAADLALLCAAGHDRVRLLTAAPERTGFAGLAQAAAEAGVLVAAGHTDATGRQLRAAIAGGVGSLTHTFNAMRPIAQRDPGVIEAIADTGVFCELICDGIHVHPALIRTLRTLAGRDRVVLVTDASAWAGSPDGDYQTPSRQVEIRAGAVRLAGTDVLAGSALTMLAAAQNYVRFTGAGLAELAAVTSGNAARLLGEHDRLGRIRPGYAADLVVLDDSLDCLGVMSAGAWARAPSDPARPPAVRLTHLPALTRTHMLSSRTATVPLPSLSAESLNGFVVDIGGTKLLTGAVRGGVIAEQRSFPISQFHGPSEMMDTIAETGRQLCSAAGISLESAVVAVAGRLDRESGSVLQAANLPFVDFPLAAELSKRLDGAPVRIEHDAVCGLIGEATAGAARGFGNVIYLTVSTGISVGILVDGALLEGTHGAAGELGHTPVESPGIACPCGSSGCLEAYASGRALAELGQQAAADGTSPALAATLAAGGAITAKDVVSAARGGDPGSAAIVDKAVGLLGRAIQLLLMTLDPELVVLGGGVMSNSYFADRLVASSRLPGDQYARARRAGLGEHSVMYGGMFFLPGRERAQQGQSNRKAAVNGAARSHLRERSTPEHSPAVAQAGEPANSDTA
jgi:N-acetylglucosamine-6-phosphate deacetylase